MQDKQQRVVFEDTFPTAPSKPASEIFYSQSAPIINVEAFVVDLVVEIETNHLLLLRELADFDARSFSWLKGALVLAIAFLLVEKLKLFLNAPIFAS
jgi:hypothetical protein